MRRAARATLYRTAAHMIEERREDRSCYAVAFLDVGDRHEYGQSPEALAYRDFMLGDSFVTASLPWADEGKDPWDYDSEEAMEIRVLLLCFMASAVETGDA